MMCFIPSHLHNKALRCTLCTLAYEYGRARAPHRFASRRTRRSSTSADELCHCIRCYQAYGSDAWRWRVLSMTQRVTWTPLLQQDALCPHSTAHKLQQAACCHNNHSAPRTGCSTQRVLRWAVASGRSVLSKRQRATWTALPHCES